MSHVRLSRVTFLFWDKVVELVGGGSVINGPGDAGPGPGDAGAVLQPIGASISIS